MKNSTILCALLAAGGALLAAIYCERCGQKVDRCESLVNKAVDGLSEAALADVRQEMVNKAVERAVERRVRITMEDINQELRENAKKELQKRVQSAVQKNSSVVANEVAEAIAKEAGKIRKEDVMDKAVEKARDVMVERVEGDLEKLAEEYMDNLTKVGRIYQGIADSIGSKADSGKGELRLSLG